AGALEELAGGLNEGWWHRGVCGGSVGVRPAHLDGAPARTEEAKKDEEREYAHRAIGPPNGSRLSCGRPARRRKSSGRQSVPARAQHSASFKATSAGRAPALDRVRPPLSKTLFPTLF